MFNKVLIMMIIIIFNNLSVHYHDYDYVADVIPLDLSVNIRTNPDLKMAQLGHIIQKLHNIYILMSRNSN